jgi:hypothetical protein
VVSLLGQYSWLACFISSSSNLRFRTKRHQNDSIVNRGYHGPLRRLETETESNAQNCDHQFVDKQRAKNQMLLASGAHANVSVGDFLVAAPTQVKLPELMPRWTIPYRMTKAINDWVYEV